MTDPTPEPQACLRKEWEALSYEERRAHADPNRKCIEPGCAEPAGTPWVSAPVRQPRSWTGLSAAG